jgi:hypothetical protein
MISKVLDANTPLHRMVCNELRERIRAANARHGRQSKVWARAEDLMLAAVPETVLDSKRRARREGGQPEYTTIQIPYSYAAIMASYSYLTSVFLARDPVHQFGGRHGETEQQQQALEAVIAYQVQVGRHLGKYHTLLYDTPKYGEGVLGIHWRTEDTRVSEIVEKADTFAGVELEGTKKKVRVTRRVPGYQGNRVYNISPTRFLTDPRVTRANFQEGEFCSVYGELSWNNYVKGHAQGRYFNRERLERKRLGGAYGDATGAENTPEASDLQRPDPNDITSGTANTTHDNIKHYEVYVELIPAEWKLGKSDLPEKWVFTITHDFNTVFECRPLGYLHDRFPFILNAAEPEGYGTYSRSFLEVLEPVQTTVDWLINSHYYNVRQMLNGVFVGDPSRIEMRDWLSDDPGKFIRLKPRAYGTDPRLAVHQLNVTDVTQNHLNDISFMYAMGERLGFNDQVMGVGSPTSRRSATEFRSTAAFSVGRLKSLAEYISSTGWYDLGHQLVSNTQQYYNAEQKLRIVGDLGAMAGPGFVMVTPESISGFYDPVLIDGTLPADRYAQGNLWRELMAQGSQIPDVAASYDMGKVFAWVAQLMGIKNITQFRRMPQVMLRPDEAIANDAAKGNVVTLKDSQLGGVPEPGQLAGMGATG